MPLSEPQRKGYVARDYAEVPEFSVFNEYSGPRIPSSEWPELIKMHNANKTMPYHWHREFCKIKSQARTNYCWMYGTIATLENRYSMQGIDDVVLNAHAIAYRGKNGANRGGYGVEACRYIQKWGVPEESVFPEFSTNTSLWRNEEVIKSANRHKLVDFEELGQSDFEGVASCLLDPVDPRPCTAAFTWWGHLVAAVGIAQKGGDFGLIIANSWGTNWGDGGLDGGYGILWGRKRTPFEAVAVSHVVARHEA